MRSLNQKWFLIVTVTQSEKHCSRGGFCRRGILSPYPYRHILRVQIYKTWVSNDPLSQSTVPVGCDLSLDFKKWGHMDVQSYRHTYTEYMSENSDHYWQWLWSASRINITYIILTIIDQWPMTNHFNTYILIVILWYVILKHISSWIFICLLTYSWNPDLKTCIFI